MLFGLVCLNQKKKTLVKNKKINYKSFNFSSFHHKIFDENKDELFDEKKLNSSKDYELENFSFKKETWFTGFLLKKFPNKPKTQFRLTLLFLPTLHIFIGVIIPSLKIDELVSQLIGGLFFLLLLPVSIYFFSLLLCSYLFDYLKIDSFNSKYGTNILGFLYIVMLSYMIYTLNDEMAGGWLTQLWMELVDY